MASPHERNGSWRILFRHRGKQYSLTLGRVSEAEARAKSDQVDYLLMRLSQGLIECPAGVRLVDFLQHDGTVPVTKQEVVVTKKVTLATLRDRYLETHGNGSLEHHTLRGIKRHFKHLARILGEGFPIRELALADLQGYVDKRAKAKGRRGPLNPATIMKEIVTLRTAWNWGVRMKLVAGRYPYDGLRYPKSDEKPPFMTRAEIERQIPGLSPAKVDELYEALYLTRPEIAALLAHVREHAAHPWIFPIVATAAHTGARKGELLRMRVGDVDLAAGVVVVREKKRAHDRRTTRRIPLSGELAAILADWLKIHPGGPLLFVQAETVDRSKTRSSTTGHQSKSRPTTKAGRRESVSEREKAGELSLSEDEAHWHLKQTLKGSEWDVIRGYHTLRHSFISACAAQGVDQRYIDEWAGHSTEEQRRRYRHLAPDLQSEKLKSVFD